MNGFRPNRFFNNFLMSCPCKFPIGRNHYITGCNMCIFSNLACVENTLCNFANSCKSIISGNSYNSCFNRNRNVNYMKINDVNKQQNNN